MQAPDATGRPGSLRRADLGEPCDPHAPSLTGWGFAHPIALVLILVFGMMGIPSGLFAENRVVIDPAHGGSDPGSRAGSAVEKDWNLRFARSIAKALGAVGIDAVLVRDKDETLDLSQRLERINTANASLALIIHADRDFTSTRSGAMIVLQPPQGVSDPLGLQPWGWLPSWRHRSNTRLAKDLAGVLGIDASFNSLSDKTGCWNERLSWEGRILCASHVHLRYLVQTGLVLTPLFITSKTDLQIYSSEEAVDGFARKVAAGVREYLRTSGEENP